MQVKIGDRAKFKDYVGTSEERGKARSPNMYGWGDWKTHTGQSCIIIERATGGFANRFDWRIRWDDGVTSLVDEGNLIIEPKYKDVIVIKEEH